MARRNVKIVEPATGSVVIENEEVGTESGSPIVRQVVQVEPGGSPIPVNVSGGNVTVTATSLEISNDAGNPIPVSAASLPLPTGAATEATMSALSDKVPALASTIPLDLAPAMPVRQVPADLWRVSFTSSGAGLLTTDITTLATGAGQAISQANGNLVITTGTTANAETMIVSARTFRGAHIARYRLQLSQRIANNAFEIALADLLSVGAAYTINSATSVTVTLSGFAAANVGQFVNLGALSSVGIPGRYAIASATASTITLTVSGWPASGSGTLTVWGWNFYRVLYDGTVATNVIYDTQRRGWAFGGGAIAGNTTAAPGLYGHMQSIGHASIFADALTPSVGTYQFAQRASRFETLPDDSTDLYLVIVARNGSVAPASTTTLTVGFVSVEMTGRQKVIMSGADQSGAGMAMVAQVVNFPATQPVSGTVTANIGTGALAAGANLIGDVALGVRATGGTPVSALHVVSAATANPTIVKASAGRLYGLALANTTASWVYAKFHNIATAPTAGTGVVRTFGIPPNGRCDVQMATGIVFAAGIGMTLVTGAADADATAVALNAIVGEVLFA